MSSEFLAGLEALVGAGGLLVDAADKVGYRGDLACPQGSDFLAVVRPRSTDETAAVMRLCQAHRIVITPRGGGTGFAGGATPTDPRPGVVLSFERMNRIRSLDPVGSSMIVEAGVTLHAAQNAANEAGWLLGIDHGGSGSSQIGGNLSTNAGGNNVLRYGMAREQVLGVEAILADGSVLDLLAPLPKNNAGYNLAQFLIGSEGTLGLITAASLRLRPRPVRRATAFIALATLDNILAVFSLTRRTIGECVNAFELIPRPGLELHFEHARARNEPLELSTPWYVLIEADTVIHSLDIEAALSGMLEDAIERNLLADGVIARSEQQRIDLWRLREGLAVAMIDTPGSIKSDTAVPIQAISAFVREATATVSQLSPGCRPVPFGHVGDGNIHFNVLPPRDRPLAEFMATRSDVVTAIEDVAIAHGGTVSAEHGIGMLKRQALRRMRPQPQLDLMREIKAVFDPRYLLNPGKII